MASLDDDDDCYHCHVMLDKTIGRTNYRLLSVWTEKPILQLRRKITDDTLNHIVQMIEDKIKKRRSG